MSELNFRVDCSNGLTACLRCMYYSSFDRSCEATGSIVPKPVAFTCDAWLSYESENKIKLDSETGNYIYKDESFSNHIDAVKKEITCRIGNGQITIKGNKIFVHGKVLPLSEYEQIADTTITENLLT